MSYWTHVRGTVEVYMFGRTQAEKRYILETVLDHLPFVTGSEGPMHVHIVQKTGHDSSSSHTEFGVYGGYLEWNKQNLSLETQGRYFLVLEGDLRDRIFEQTYRELQKWLCRLAKRVWITQVLVEVRGYEKSAIIHDYYDKYEAMLEDGKLNWCEYLMWERAEDSDYPMKLAHKYFSEE